MKYLICIPTYNEKENIKKLLAAILAQDQRIDVLVIDDNSPDGTGKLADKLAKKNSRIKVLHRQGKLGIGSAYIEGFKYALTKNYDLIFQMDADFSHNPKYLKELIRASQKYDLVLGSRWIKGGDVIGWPWYRYLTSWSANLFTRVLLSLKPRDITTGYRCYKREVLATINLSGIVASGYAFLEELIYRVQKAGFSIGEIPIIFIDRKKGQSKMTKKEIISSAKTILKLFFKRKGVTQVAKFGVVGLSGTIIDLGIYNLLSILLGVNIYFARTISFILAATNNYFLNRKWTFRSTEKKVVRQYGQFFLVSAIGLCLNLLIMRLLQTFASRFSSEILRKNIPVIIAIIIVFIWNYMANKMWTFKTTDKH